MGEDPLAAARREVQEETLIEDLHFDWGEGFIETAPYNRNKIARYYLARTLTEAVSLPVRPELGRPEHHESRWLAGEEALELASPRLAPIIRWAIEALARHHQRLLGARPDTPANGARLRTVRLRRGCMPMGHRADDIQILAYHFAGRATALDHRQDDRCENGDGPGDALVGAIRLFIGNRACRAARLRS